MDACIEDGERTMFFIQRLCSREKSLLAACLMNRDDCEEKLLSLHDCTRCGLAAALRVTGSLQWLCSLL